MTRPKVLVSRKTALSVKPLYKGAYVRIIVTGGAGFIGSHIVDAYVALGHDVLVLDSLWEHGGGRRENVSEKAQFIEVDIRDAAIAKIFADFKPEIVSHHAAQHSVAISSREPAYDADVNVRGLLNILDNSVKIGAKKVVFAGSGASFGDPESLPMTEKTPQRPTSPYGITKMVAEHYLRFYHSEHGLDFTSLRYGNVYGPRQDPNGEAGVISIFIGKFLQQQGIRIDSDGEQTRDYVYVKDVAQANVAALERGGVALKRGGGGCYVIGTNKRTSVNELYRSLVTITGFEAPVTPAPKRPGDARDAQFDPALAKAELGWTPATDLLDGIRATYEYFRELRLK
jgi:UDP-glucose 4-epimerase